MTVVPGNPPSHSVPWPVRLARAYNRVLTFIGFIEQGETESRIPEDLREDLLSEDPLVARTARRKALLLRIEVLDQNIQRRAHLNRYALSGGFLFVCLAAYFALNSYRHHEAFRQAFTWFAPFQSDRFNSPVLFFLCSFVTLYMITRPFRRPLSELYRQLEATDAQYDLALTEMDVQGEMRAEKLFRAQQLELRRFHHQGLRHSSLIFAVGVLCLLAGVAIVLQTLQLVADPKRPDDKLITAITGGIGGILTNFVAAIFLKMFADTAVRHLRLYEGMRRVHEAHMANFLASKLGDFTLRDKTLSDLALRLVQPETAPADGPTG